MSTLLPRPDVERQGYFYEVRSKRTSDSITFCMGVAEEDLVEAVVSGGHGLYQKENDIED
ncbi:MAG: hypothetical protein ACYC6R_17875 [Anaerolineales bacterium]